jgi:copper chaperone
MSTTTYTVQGMTCTGCANKVSGAVQQVAGVTDAQVDLETGTVTVTGQTDGDVVRTAIRDAGYQSS